MGKVCCKGHLRHKMKASHATYNLCRIEAIYNKRYAKSSLLKPKMSKKRFLSESADEA